VLVDGIWGSLLTDKVKQFQQQSGLDADGAVGPMSWAKLMER
jgi:peptidoglycan hydrolase-like protein with peptidoglycan-binding domain